MYVRRGNAVECNRVKQEEAPFLNEEITQH
jgi:hypothetical protein